MVLICEYCKGKIHLVALGVRTLLVSDLGDITDPCHLPSPSEQFPFHGSCFGLWAYERLKGTQVLRPGKGEPQNYRFVTTEHLVAFRQVLVEKRGCLKTEGGKNWIIKRIDEINRILERRSAEVIGKVS